MTLLSNPMGAIGDLMSIDSLIALANKGTTVNGGSGLACCPNLSNCNTVPGCGASQG